MSETTAARGLWLWKSRGGPPYPQGRLAEAPAQKSSAGSPNVALNTSASHSVLADLNTPMPYSASLEDACLPQTGDIFAAIRYCVCVK